MELLLSCLAESDRPSLPLHAVTSAGLQELGQRLPYDAAAFLAASGFAARPHQLCLLPGPGGIIGAVLGLGDGPDRASDPYAHAGLPFALPEGTVWHLAEPDSGMAATLGWCLGAYRFRHFTPPQREPAQLCRIDGTEPAVFAAAAAWRARDLINLPANHLGPVELAGAVLDLARAHGATARIIDGPALAEGFPAIAAVGQGSDRPACVAILEWGDPTAPLVALCGKGVCFDTGGLDLKPAAAMQRMKKDMGGAAMLIGAAELIMRLALPVRLLLLVGAVENSVGSAAFRPGDVLATRAGLRVEIGNTDAEGRLVLADLLAYASEQDPALIIDAATLTGAARVALGPDLPALFTADDALAATLVASGTTTADPLWRLPLHAGYASWLDSTTGDLNNISVKPMAGAIVAALFLHRFVRRDVPWAHVDLYAWNDGARPGRPEGGEAQGMRAVVDAIAARFGGARLRLTRHETERDG